MAQNTERRDVKRVGRDSAENLVRNKLKKINRSICGLVYCSFILVMEKSLCNPAVYVKVGLITNKEVDIA